MKKQAFSGFGQAKTAKAAKTPNRPAVGSKAGGPIASKGPTKQKLSVAPTPPAKSARRQEPGTSPNSSRLRACLKVLQQPLVYIGILTPVFWVARHL